jgi:uncharacterized repeat protein (TIGR03803 family)
MESKSRVPNLVFGPTLSPASAALAIMLTLLFLILLLLLMNLTALPAQAQTFKVLYNFTGGADGSRPVSPLTLDAAGNLYGTTLFGGVGGECTYNCGTVFKLSHKGSNWILNPLYDFSGSDGANPFSNGVIFGPDGTLYGATAGGGSAGGGVVYNLRPEPTACKTALCQWTETVLYNFQGWPAGDGSEPWGNLTFDKAGNLYAATNGGGYCQDCGTVFELTPSGSGWTESILYFFYYQSGRIPDSSVIFDQSGNLYGTTSSGGTGDCDCGTVYELTPSGNGWTDTILYSFQGGNDGAGPPG